MSFLNLLKNIVKQLNLFILEIEYNFLNIFNDLSTLNLKLNFVLMF